jgi:hypothetical protein
MADTPGMPERSYGCTFGCGNPYDYVIVSVADSTVELLCLPCYVRLAADMVTAITQPDDPAVMEALQAVGRDNLQSVPGPKGKKHGHNAPANTTDDGVIEAFDSVVTVDELPPEFR